jgi:hypothetical protein
MQVVEYNAQLLGAYWRQPLTQCAGACTQH